MYGCGGESKKIPIASKAQDNVFYIKDQTIYLSTNKTTKKQSNNSMRFVIDFGTHFGPKMDPKSTKMRYKKNIKKRDLGTQKTQTRSSKWIHPSIKTSD